MNRRSLLWTLAGLACVAAAAALPFLLRNVLGPGGMPRAIAYRALPAADAVLSHIAFGSALAQDRPQPVLDALRRQAPDLFIFAGDNVFGEAAEPAPSLPDLRRAYGRLSRRGEFRRLVHAVPVMAVWNDRDYGRLDAGADFAHRREAARLFRAFWGVRGGGQRARREGLYAARIFGPPGRRVQVILLDTRSFRSPLKRTEDWNGTGRPGYVPDEDAAKTMLGEAQWKWLEAQLLRPAELRLIVSSIQVIAEGHPYEKWANLPLERRRLFDLIGLTGARGVVFLSGGRHAGGLYELADGTPYPLYEVTSGSLNRPDPAAAEPGAHRLGPLHTEAGYGRIDVDWPGRQVMLALYDARGRPVDGRALSVAFDSLDATG